MQHKFALLCGPYETPLFEYGDLVWCDWRGEVEIVGLTDGKIPWPIGQKGSSRTLVIFAGLSAAIRSESNQAVCHWWGVTPQTVTKWRKALGVGAVTKGTSHLRAEHAKGESGTEARKQAVKKAQDPERRRKIANARRGKKRPKHVMEALRKANIGRELPEAQKRKMSEAHKRRGTIPPKAGRVWTHGEDEIVKTCSPAVAATQTGRTLQAVYGRRRKLGISKGQP